MYIMEKIAIITSAVLPVPAIKGGAVETLITQLVESNEKDPKFQFDIYTMPCEGLDAYQYHYSRVCQVQGNVIDLYTTKVLNKLEQFRRKGTTSFYDVTLLRRLFHGNYDYILVENTAHFYHLAYRLKRYRGKLMFHLHNNVDSARTEDDLRFIIQTAYRVLGVSNYTCSLLQSIQSGENIKTLYNCVDQEKFRNDNIEGRQRIRERYGLNDKTVFMFSGRLDHVKGFIELLKAFEIAVERNDKAVLLVAGGNSPWSNRDAVKTLWDELSGFEETLGNRVIFTGMLPYQEMPDYYAAADVMVVPSMWEEPFGMIALEAMSCGLPLIISDSGALPEIVDEECAIVIKRGEGFVEELARTILWLAKDLEKRESMCKASLNRIEQVDEFDAVNYIHFFKESGIE